MSIKGRFPQEPFQECWARRADLEGHYRERVGRGSAAAMEGAVLLAEHGGGGLALVELFATDRTVGSAR